MPHWILNGCWYFPLGHNNKMDVFNWKKEVHILPDNSTLCLRIHYKEEL